MKQCFICLLLLFVWSTAQANTPMFSFSGWTQGGEEPDSSPDEPTKPSNEPGPKENYEPAPLPLPPVLTITSSQEAVYGIGSHFQGVFLPKSFLEGTFFQVAHPLQLVSFGFEVVRRRKNFELIGSVDYGFYSFEDGNFVEKNKKWREDTDYVQFDALNVLSFNAQFIWHHPFTNWFSIIYGVGVGFGVVFGDVWRISNFCPDADNKAEIEDYNICHPQDYEVADRKNWVDNRNPQLENTPDTHGEPHVFREKGIWPVVPILDLIVGVNFKVHENFDLRVVGGSRDGLILFFGAAGQYFF